MAYSIFGFYTQPSDVRICSSAAVGAQQTLSSYLTPFGIAVERIMLMALALLT